MLYDFFPNERMWWRANRYRIGRAVVIAGLLLAVAMNIADVVWQTQMAGKVR